MTKPKPKRRRGSAAAIPGHLLRRAKEQQMARKIAPANPAAVPRVRARRSR